jgi:hypothetical protein
VSVSDRVRIRRQRVSHTPRPVSHISVPPGPLFRVRVRTLFSYCSLNTPPCLPARRASKHARPALRPRSAAYALQIRPSATGRTFIDRAGLPDSYGRLTGVCSCLRLNKPCYFRPARIRQTWSRKETYVRSVSLGIPLQWADPPDGLNCWKDVLTSCWGSRRRAIVHQR